MQKLDLFKKMLPGFLPLVVFIIVDSFLGTLYGIVFAVGFGLVELLVIYLKERKIDKFVIGDTALLGFMGAISIILENDVFFKLKPALIELILCGIIGFSVFSDKNLILKMSQRYLKGIEMNQTVEDSFNRSLKIFFWLILAHVTSIIYSAVFMSQEAWVFISGGLFYIIFAVYFGFEIIRSKLKKNRYKNEEWFPLVDPDGKIIGKAPRSVCHSGTKLLHPVVHVHIFNRHHQLFLQKRSLNKDTQPGKWDTSVGGHLSHGESLETGLAREVEEEIGLVNLEYRFIAKYIWESEIEKELSYVFFAEQNGDLKINPDEIDEGKFWNWNELNKSLGKNIFTPNFENELKMFNNLFQSKIN
jgi:isopentenyl-diphosphate delta-isomerase type 1